LLIVAQVTAWWSQVKTAGSAIYANRHHLEVLRTRRNVAARCRLLPDVFLHPSALVDPSAVVNKQP
jgi:mannose-1-phosphate guanylyltransferase